MPFEPPAPSTPRRTHISRWVSFLFAALLVALVAYFGYIAYEGSRQLVDAPTPTADCRTPATFGWEYEAVNYDIAGDAPLAEEPDPKVCAARGTPAGDELAARGGPGLAGWYVPAANGNGPAAATVVLAHGWGSNKSAMLDRAALLHESYNLAIFDFRNHGQSGEALTTQGVREAHDLDAILDWLEATKGPESIAVLGSSMGGATALNTARSDERIDVLVVESTHATLANAIQARLDSGGYPLSVAGSWATLLGGLIRTGEDFSAADPVQSIAHLDGRPVLLVHGEADDAIGPNDSAQMLDAAVEAGSPVELHVCADAGHAASPDVCTEDYGAWVLGFLDRFLAP